LISTMREYFRGLKFVLLIVIVAFIATSVVYFGADAVSRGGVGDHAVASVNGEEIPVERFRRAYSSYVEFYRQIYKDRLTPEMAERLGIQQQVINDLVQDALIGQQARREGVTVTDDEVRGRIQQIRAFQEDGRFSRERYLTVLKQVRIDPSDFESDQRRDLIRRKMESLVKDGVKVTPDEVAQAYAFRKERVRAAWASVDVVPLMATITVADTDLEPYVKAHQAQFTRAERRKVELAVISPKAFAEPVSDSIAEAYYNEHPTEFEKPRRLRAAHVLVRVPPVGGSDAEAKSRAKVEDVIKRARAGEDFAKLARENSEDTATAPQGGDLGFVGPGEMVPQFEQAVFALKKGELSPAPVRTPFGYHAIKVVDVQEGGRAPYKEVASKIKEKLLAERSEKAALAKADSVKGPLQASKDFVADARKLGVEARAVSMTRGDGLEGIGRDAALEDAVFGLTAGGVSSAIKTPAGWVVAKVVEVLPAGVPPLAEIRNDVTEAIKRERAGALAMDKAKNLATAASKDGDLAGAAKKEGATAGETTLFSRSEAPKEKPTLPGAVLLAALQTPVGQVAEPVRAPSSVYVVKTLERQAPDLKGLDTERQELTKQVLEQKRAQVWESWMGTLNQSAKIEMSGPAAAAPAR
jgi:peptidyl-prolyl cis-trans isomerase D